MKTASIQLFVTYFFFIQSTCGQCPLNCFCFDSSVTCIGLKSIPTLFPEDTRYLTISEIDIDQIPAGVFNRLPLLESIEIYDGSVGRISSDAFQSLSLLEFITLSELSIGTIESYAFNNITDTGSVSLDMSTVDLIQPYAFFEIFSVDHVKLSSNKVNYIDSFAFNTIDGLLEFSFQSNHVNTMRPYAFSQFTNLYEFTMILNTIGYVGCGSFETLLYQTDEQSFYSNKFNCTCDIVWASSTPSLNKFLVSSSCLLPGTEEKINWENVSTETLHCTDINKYECPSANNLEMLIPNIRMTSSPTEKRTRPSSSTASPRSAGIDLSMEEWSGEPIFTPTIKEVQAETTANKEINTISRLLSTATLERLTTKTMTTKTIITAPPSTIPTIGVNIEDTKSMFQPSNPKIVITKEIAEFKPENSIEQKGDNHESVSAVLKEAEGNGAKVISLCWFGLMTVSAFAVI